MISSGRFILETDRLSLREFTKSEEDINALSIIMGDAEVMRHSYRGPQTREETSAQIDRFLLRYARDKTGPWALSEKSTQKIIGFCGLPVQEIDGVRELEVGYGMLPNYWGMGYAKESTCACRDYAFLELGAERIVSIISPANSASIKIAQGMGMSFEKDSLFYGRSVCVYSLTRKTWDHLREQTTAQKSC